MPKAECGILIDFGNTKIVSVTKFVRCHTLDITPAVCYIINNEFVGNGIKIPIGGMFGAMPKRSCSIIWKGVNVRIDYHIKAFVNDWS